MSCFFLHTHKEIRDKIYVTDIAEFFVSSNSRRLNLFGFLKEQSKRQ